MPQQRRRTPLSEIDLFTAMDAEAKREVEAAGTRRIIPRGKFLFREGEPAQGLHVLLSGRLKSVRLLPGRQEIMMHFIEPGQLFGEIPAFLEVPYPASAQAIEEAEVFTISRGAMERLTARHPGFAMQIFRSMAKKLNMLIEKIEVQKVLRAEQRIARYLLTHATPEILRGRRNLLLPSTKKVWAGELGLQPESIARSLGKLRRDKLIQVDGREITLLDVDGLAVLAKGGGDG